jgi:hypothetical protein
VRKGRDAYLREFGVAHTDRSIDQKLASLMESNFLKGKGTVTVPIEIALALWLREGGRGSRTGPLADFAKIELRDLMTRVVQRKRDLMNQSHSATEAGGIAAREFSASSGFSVERIIHLLAHRSEWDTSRPRRARRRR